MTRREKQKVLNILGLAVLMTVLLATSLSQLEFRPGIPPPTFEGSRLIIPQFPQSAPANLHIFTFLISLLGFIAGAYLLVVFFLWALGVGVMGISWKKLLGNLPRFFLILAGILILLVPFLLSGSPQEISRVPASPPAESPTTPFLGPPPPFLFWLVGLCLAILAAFLLNSWLVARRKPEPMDQLAMEAEKAWQNILAGQELKEIILRCYQQMSQILFQEGGIERQAFMTSSEFERELVAACFPQASVHHLTRLFEIARYGNWVPNFSDEQKALESLQGIILYLREKKASGHDQ